MQTLHFTTDLSLEQIINLKGVIRFAIVSDDEELSNTITSAFIEFVRKNEEKKEKFLGTKIYRVDSVYHDIKILLVVNDIFETNVRKF